MGHRVPPNCNYWDVFLICRDIVDIVIAPKVKRESLSMLNLLVCEFLTKLKDVFGDVITPKCHYMIHYARLIAMYGPLRMVWCMRFEAKHQYLKTVASNCRNFINVAKTLSDRHQMRQCWEFSQDNILDEFEMVTGASTDTLFSSLPLELQRCLARVHGSQEALQNMQCVSRVIIDSVKYACKDVLIVDYLHAENIPLFFIIKYILNVNTLWLLCGKLLVPMSYDSHLHAYTVKVDTQWSVIKPGQEMDFQSLDVYNVDDKLYVTLRNI